MGPMVLHLGFAPPPCNPYHRDRIRRNRHNARRWNIALIILVDRCLRAPIHDQPRLGEIDPRKTMKSVHPEIAFVVNSERKNKLMNHLKDLGQDC